MPLAPYTIDPATYDSDPDECHAELTDWLDDFYPFYHQSNDYLSLPVSLQKSGGQIFRQFLELNLYHLGKGLADIDRKSTQKVIIELFPHYFFGSDQQVKHIIPELIACWACLHQTMNHNNLTLKHSADIISYLTNIEKTYPKTFKDRSIHQAILDEYFTPDDDNEDEDEDEDDETWLDALIDDAVQNLEAIKKSPRPPESWFRLYDYQVLSAFFYEICVLGIEEEETEAITALLDFALTNLFIHIRQGDKDAINAWAELEDNIMTAFEANELDDAVMPPLLRVLANFRQHLSETFINFTQDWQPAEAVEKYADEEFTIEKLNNACLQLFNDIPDAFDFAKTWQSEMGFLPEEAITIIAEHILSVSHPKAADYLALLLLDERNSIAKAVADSLKNHADCITPLTLDRLIRIRNWLPKNIQQPIDQLIRNVRKRGVIAHRITPLLSTDIEAWMSAVDGSGAQGVLAIVPDKVEAERFRMVNFVFKELVGIVDIVVSPPETRSRLASITTMVRNQLGVLEKVSPTIILQQIPIFIWHNLNSSTSINHDLVHALEQLGIQNWNPAATDIKSLYASFTEASQPPSVEEIKAAQQRSSSWVESRMGESWLIGEPFSLNITPGGSIKTTIQTVCNEYLDDKRAIWLERMQRMTVWAKHCESQQRQRQAKDFSTISWLLEQDTPTRDIKLMEAIAKRSI